MTDRTASTPLVTVSDLHKTFHISRPPREVLRGVSLTVGRGEFVAVMGPSGCGKSTLLHAIGGLEPPDRGTVAVDGQDLHSLDDERLSAFRRDRIGFVFQRFNLISSLTAAENIALPLRLRGRTSRPGRTAVMERVSALMDSLSLHRLQGHGPEETSGGEQQRVAIARALAASPVLILADEPTGNLDWSTGHEVMWLISKLCRSEGRTTVLVTHDARIAAYADRVLVMKDGTLVEEVVLDHRADTEGRPPAAGRLIARLADLEL